MSDWVQTYTGKAMYPLEPRAEQICIEDIAHALSMKCRFNGHCREFYSVAQHSVLVSELAASRGGPAWRCMSGLLHDAAEAYLPDICSPIKPNVCVALGTLPGKFFVEPFSLAEGRVLLEISRALEVDINPRNVRTEDLILLATERRDLMAESELPWGDWIKSVEPLPERIVPQPPQEAKREFLAVYQRLVDAMWQETQAAAGLAE